MQSQATRPEWFQTVPFVRVIDPEFDVVEYFGDFEVDEDAKDVLAILRMSDLLKVGTLASEKVTHYKELIADLRLSPWSSGVEMNDKLDRLDCLIHWEQIAIYKDFQVLVSTDSGHILISQSDGPCFQTRDGWDRFCEIDSHSRESVAIADAQEFIDSFVLSLRNDDPEYDWNVLGRLQLSLPL